MVGSVAVNTDSGRGRRALHIVIMGCGRVGSALARSLLRLEHTVAVIDQDPTAFKRLGESFTGQTVTGVGFDRDTLIKAGVERAEAFAAVSSGDNSNIIAARVARETFGVSRVVARIYDPKRAEVYERLGIPTVATVPWTAQRLEKTLLASATAQEWRDPSDSVSLIHVRPHEGWVGHKLTDLEAATGARTALITRFGTGQLPSSSTVLQAGDTVHMLVTDEFRDVLGATASHAPLGAHQ
jgi:trk system potassium uptake protein TrkA